MFPRWTVSRKTPQEVHKRLIGYNTKLFEIAYDLVNKKDPKLLDEYNRLLNPSNHEPSLVYKDGRFIPVFKDHMNLGGRGCDLCKTGYALFENPQTVKMNALKLSYPCPHKFHLKCFLTLKDSQCPCVCKGWVIDSFQGYLSVIITLLMDGESKDTLFRSCLVQGYQFVCYWDLRSGREKERIMMKLFPKEIGDIIFKMIK